MTQVSKVPLHALRFLKSPTLLGGCQNYGPFLGHYYNTAPFFLGYPKRDPKFENYPFGGTEARVCLAEPWSPDGTRRRRSLGVRVSGLGFGV